MGAPVVKTIDDCLDPERAYELLPGKTRSSTLLRATGGRLAWAAKDKIVEVLYEGAPLIRRAPRYPVTVLVAIERVVVDENELTGLRVYAWAKLVKACGLAKVVGPPSHPPWRGGASGGPIGHHATPDQDVWTKQTHQGDAAMCQ